MSFSSLLDHRVSIVRQVADLDPDGEPEYDDYNHAITADSTNADVPAAIQPKKATEVALISNAGAALSDYTIYLHMRDITTADAVVHDIDACPKTNAIDLPTVRFQLVGVPNPTGRGHHMSLDAKLIEAPTIPVPAAPVEAEGAFSFTTAP